MTRTVVRHRVARLGRSTGGACSKTSEAIRYLGRRPRGAVESEADRALFDRDGDGITRVAARASLIAQATGLVAYHRLVLSPGSGAETMTRAELLLWTRRMMADLEGYRGRELTWVAAVHRHSTHPHVHVLVGASTGRLGGAREAVRFTRDDYAVLRESGDRWADRARNDRSLLDEVERYLVQVAGATIAGMARHSIAAQGQRDADDEEDERRRRDGRSR